MFFFHNRNSSCDNNEILVVINMQCYCVKKADKFSNKYFKQLQLSFSYMTFAASFHPLVSFKN